jgi:hypothetical protein
MSEPVRLRCQYTDHNLTKALRAKKHELNKRSDSTAINCQERKKLNRQPFCRNFFIQKIMGMYRATPVKEKTQESIPATTENRACIPNTFQLPEI